jgi:hypothetical protein
MFIETAFQYKDSLSQMERSLAMEDFLNIDQKQRQQELATAKRYCFGCALLCEVLIHKQFASKDARI